MINLPDVTLAIATSVKIEEGIQAVLNSRARINFAKIVFISHEKPDFLPPKIEFRRCMPIKNLYEYSELVFKYLGYYIDTSHCLLIQPDSWVINPHLWDDNWLQYDYIGAPWAIKENAYVCKDTGEHVRVGNGGFSLRSRKIMDFPLLHKIPLIEEQGFYNEDGNICVYHRTKFLELGIKYAPVEVAARFSYENPVPENSNPPMKTFGFHKNLRGGW